MITKKLLEILACPACKGHLVFYPERSELWCRADQLAYRIEADIPVMLIEEARKLSQEELEA